APAAEARRFDLSPGAGFSAPRPAGAPSGGAPAVTGHPEHRTGTWAGLAGILIGWTLVAVAPFARGRVESRRTALVDLLVGLAFVLFLVWAASRALGLGLPDLQPAPGRNVPNLLTETLALLALVNLVGVIGFGHRFRTHGEDLDRWLALGLTLMLFGSIHLVFSPLAGTALVAQGDFLRLLAYCVLLVGVWRAIR